MSQTIGTIFIVVAPSGAGKTSLVAALLAAEPTVELSVSYTTRAPRAGEVNGQHYHFVDRATFERMIADGDFLEYAEVYGNYYGSSASWLKGRLDSGRDILLEIDWQGAQQVRKVFPDALSVFIMPPSMQELERRLRGRATDSEEVIARRMAEARAEIAKATEYDYILVNDNFESACADLVSIVRAARLTRAKQQVKLAETLATMRDGR
ncbi:guanylate kinase [Paludibacterium denitrificans]|uniref:Guanylate kinase n=1 Tax=Paludibacterium denitrificans TaxID=2675226 RepID=A0A844GDL3_9NEIS|nr:guanylate kinase [Paludibacterium denitrificans]MTD33400.1 guanylate kinase [Paludibacterium denitrificans]